jgi:adenylate cyclase
VTELRRHQLKQIAKSFGIAFAITFVYACITPDRQVHPLLTMLVFGVPFGAFFGFAGPLFRKARHRSFALTLVLQGCATLLILVGAFVFSLWPYIALHESLGLFDSKMLQILAHILGRGYAAASLMGAFLLTIVFSCISQVSRKLGPGVLWNWVTGKYHEPREEERIFMFLDIKDSTMLGERLGNLKFSALVRDFFSDLTRPLIECKGEVSHYIGDEAVLTWTPPRGLARANCLRFFFSLKEEIRSKSAHYEGKYGVVPSFKAGVHIGPVVATEVGQLKSEIVYHGDVLNTASRLQSHCNVTRDDLLVSGDLMARLQLPEGWHAHSLGSVLFKGKEHEVKVFGVYDRMPEPEPAVGRAATMV